MMEFIEKITNVILLFYASHITNVSTDIFSGFELLRMSKCYVFGGLNHKTNMFEIIFYDITNQINEIVINIDSNIFKTTNINTYYSFKSPFSISHIYKLIDDGKINITVDNEAVSDYILQSIKNQSIKQD